MEEGQSPLMISKTRLKRLKVQGFCNISDAEISQHAFGNRFAYMVCSTIATFGVIYANITLLGISMIIALGGALLPYHPVDYVFNSVIRKWIGRPKLPKRTAQAKFACGLATLWLATTIYFFYSGMTTAGYIFGSVLLVIGWLVSILDFCIPSIIYNFIFKVKVDE